MKILCVCNAIFVKHNRVININLKKKKINKRRRYTYKPFNFNEYLNMFQFMKNNAWKL